MKKSKSSIIIFDHLSAIIKSEGHLLIYNSIGLPVLCNIIDKMIYEDNYDGIEDSMSDSNIGARRKKNIRNHLFIIYGIINAVIQGQDGCIDIQIYDLIQAFDALWLDDCLNEIYDSVPANIRDDKIALLYQMNTVNKVSVNTAMGQTDRVEVNKTQGSTW